MAIDIGQAVNDVAFWAGSPPDELLVVINRGAWSGQRQQLGLPSDTDVTARPRGLVTVRGVVEPLPYAEAMSSWGLTRRDVAVAQERSVYVRVDRIPSAAAATASGRGRRRRCTGTVPPPGEQVETPLDVRPLQP